VFNGPGSTTEIMCRRTVNYSVIMSSELVKYVGGSVVANKSYGISAHVRRKCMAFLIHDSTSMMEILARINLI
jgi:hypothetical protein